MDRTSATGGIVGPVLFAAVILAQQLLRRGTYDPIAQQISDLTAGTYGWVQQLNFIVFGLLVIAFAAALHRRVRPARAGVVGPAILGLNGAGLVVAGLFPLRESAGGLAYDPVGVHSVNGAIFFLTTGAALVALGLRLWSDPRWRRLATYTLVTGVALLVLFITLGTLARPADAPLHRWLGLAQRLDVVVWCVCILLLAIRLRHTTTTPYPSPHGGPAHG